MRMDEHDDERREATDRRGGDPALLAVVNARLEDHARQHQQEKEHRLQLQAEVDLRYDQRFNASQQAIEAARLSTEKAVDAALQSAQSDVENLAKRVDEIGSRVTTIEASKSGKSEVLPWIVAAIAVLVLLFNVFGK